MLWHEAIVLTRFSGFQSVQDHMDDKSTHWERELVYAEQERLLAEREQAVRQIVQLMRRYEIGAAELRALQPECSRPERRNDRISASRLRSSDPDGGKSYSSSATQNR